MKEYRTSKSREEIIKIVQKEFDSQALMTIWQKDPESGERLFKCDVTFSSLDPHEGTFGVAIEEIKKAKFNPKLETYFLLQIQDFVFKTKSSVVEYNKRGFLLFRLPPDVRLEEKRIHPRIYIPPEEKRFISAKFSSKDKSILDVECPVYNISISGICIIISKETLSTVKLNEEISLEGLSFFETLGNEMKAVVRNARVHAKKELGSDEFYALGLEFSNKG